MAATLFRRPNGLSECGKASFAVLSISRDQYTRRCRGCGHTNTLSFGSTLKKTVIYVDQFAISNMMKAIDVAADADGRAAADPLWLELF